MESSDTFATKDELDAMKRKFNTLVKLCSNLKADTITDLNTLNKRITDVANYATSLESSIPQTISTETGESIDLSTYATKSDIDTIAQRLNSLVDYLEHWIDIGNVNMNDIRDSVGADQSFTQ